VRARARTDRRRSPEEALRALSPSRLESELRNEPDPKPKDDAIIFRVSGDEKREIQRTAKGFGLKVTEYLLRLHRLVIRKSAGRG